MHPQSYSVEAYIYTHTHMHRIKMYLKEVFNDSKISVGMNFIVYIRQKKLTDSNIVFLNI